MTTPEFKPWPKIPRHNKPLIITEKIDGTNAIIHVSDDCSTFHFGSRTRWLTFDDDNFGFARWAHDNVLELVKLGPGYHYGEWYGSGIQRGYGLPSGERRFALFNTNIWGDGRKPRPACCGVVPLLHTGDIATALQMLRENGSYAVPGFMRPEGIVVYNQCSGTMHKVLLENPDVPKSLVEKGAA